MGKLNADGIKEISIAKKERTEAINNLMDHPFNVANTDQMAAIKKYIDDFELSVNQMYLFQGMTTGLFTGGLPWIAGFLLPIPDFVKYFLSTFIYFGLAGCILQKFNTTDFYNDVEEMKAIYNWTLKGGKNIYEGTENIEKLNHPDMQRMVKLLAPLCTVEFMQAWPKLTQESEASTGLGAVYSVSQKLWGRFFSSAPEPSDKLKVLQAQVEMGELNMNAMTGLEQAIRYFTTNANFKALMMSQVQAPIEYVKGKLPEVVTSNLPHLKMN